jgi:MYXO-CTERM domain-containing protein
MSFAGRFLGMVVGLVTLSIAAGAAQAHITLKTPKPWTVATTGQKGPPPCGNTMPTRNPTTYRPGETIMVEWDETIKHPGRFRIAFAEQGQTVPNPMTVNDMSTALPIFIDGIDAKTGTAGGTPTHRRMITFPNKPCASCTLQLIQVMKVNPPYNATADNDVYYQCAAIILAGDPVAGDGGAPADAGSDGGAGMGGGGSGGSMGTGGSTGTGGSIATGGSTGTPTGGASGTGGKPATGGSKGGGDTGGAGGEDETGGSGGSVKRGTGGCAVGGGGSAGGLLLLALALLRRRRR